MNSTTHKERFFSAIPKTEAQFGNLITLREKEGSKIPGIHQGFLASLIQFQPLIELTLFNSSGGKVCWEKSEHTVNPVEVIKRFEAEGLSLVQRTIVQGDEVLLDLELQLAPDDSLEKPRIEFSGASLFSPQGVPYHWDEERRISWRRNGKQELTGQWGKDVYFSLSFSEELNSLTLKQLASDDVVKDQYFSSFNLKKRFTYWVPLEKRRNDEVLNEVSSRNTGYCGIWTPSFSPDGRAFMAIRFSLSKEISGIVPKPQADYDAKKISLSKNWEQFVDNFPEFSCSDSDLERIYYTSWYILQSGQISFPQERFRHSFTSVNKFHYYNQFFWDSAFQAIAWLWYNEAGPAESEMKNFVSQQWRNGMIPYELFMYPINGREWMDGDGRTTGTTQPPVIGITIREVFNKYKNTDYPAYFYNSLLKYENWLSLYRDLDKRGLSSYINIWETGWDNSPRFDKAARNRVLDPYIEGVDFNVYIYQLRQTILDMARWLEKPEPELVRKRMEMSKKSMNELMYREDDGFYYDLEAGTSERVLVKTAAGLLPLLTDIPDKKQKLCLIKNYLMSEEEFFTGAPVPSVSRSEESYDPRDFWRGANWPQITWSILYGIKDDYPCEAGDILDRFLSKTSLNTNCYEYYHSETGEGAGLPFQGWGALYTDFIIRFIGGINPTEEGFNFRPLSKRYTKFEFHGIQMRNTSLSISRDDKVWELKWEGIGEIKFSGIDTFNAEFNSGQIILSFSGKDPESSVVSSGKAEWAGTKLRLG